jgi:hypothetical protein
MAAMAKTPKNGHQTASERNSPIARLGRFGQNKDAKRPKVGKQKQRGLSAAALILVGRSQSALPSEVGSNGIGVRLTGPTPFDRCVNAEVKW